ncbi:MAG: hypothetical protein K2I96_15895, partial [Lachnospiraceae bacterium]|nr:hypothetical protein [Lachnospiraceae bacterium]
MYKIDNIKAKLSANDRIRLLYHKTILKIKNRNVKRDCKEDRKVIDKAILDMKNFGKSSKKRLLVAGCVGLCPKTAFLAKLNAALPPDYDVVLLLENNVSYYSLDNQKYPNVTDEEYIALKQFIVPKLFGKNNYRPYAQVEILPETKKLLQEKPFLNEAAMNLYIRHFDMRKDYAEYFAIRSYDYLNQVIEALHPDCVMLWNQFFAFHHIFEGVCRERGIKCTYFEFGVLPGTYAIEAMGQMGESYPAQKYAEFANLNVSDEEIERADEVWRYIKENRINRKEQPKRDISKILKKKLIKGRPTIFVAGQNDYESGVCPYTEHTRKYHSPIFESSDDVVEYLAKLAKKNRWNLIYKMHPLVTRYCLPKHFSGNVIILNDVDINDLIEVSDLTITILSQTGYVALFNEKPVLMLGYTQLRGKGCNYEAFKKENIEPQIELALNNGFTKDQKNNFRKHIAQICKYYVYE